MSNKVPQIRFNGYSDDWEERKLGDVGNTFTGLTGKTKEDFGHGSAKFVTYVNVFQNSIATLDQLDAIEIDEKQNQVQKGDIFFTTSSETPEEVGMSSVWTHDTENVYLNSFTFGYRPRVSFDLNYMASMLRSPSIRKKITFLAQGISRYNISKTKMLEIEIPTPTLSEQEKIGSFFKQLDNTIALHQRKLDLLKEQKKGYLQKMFPKNGAKVPELRFAGFADDWEERKLGDLGDILRKSIDPQLTPSREFVEYSMPSYDRGKRPNRVLGESMQSTRLKISGTVLLINKLNVRQRRIWFVKKAPENAVASGEFVPFQSFEIDLGFLHQLFLSDKTTSELQSISSGTSNSQKRVTPSDLLHYPIYIPTTKGEQVVVGRFLSSIDNLITLHQRKLDLLKEQKNGFLQKMFI